ncbi:hypothetical protein ABKN59_005422 [Abortiporus biennis]
MIILDEDEQQLPKLTNPAPVYSTPPVNRQASLRTTSTYSLPSYETSEAQKLQIIEEEDVGGGARMGKRARRRKYWRITLFILILYCALTLVIGIPILVVKLRHEHIEDTGQTSWNPQQANVVPILSGQNLVSNPPPYHSAIMCDQWDASDREGPGSLRYQANLNYTLDVQPNGLYMGANTTFKIDGQNANGVSGTLLVGMNPDHSATDAHITVNMVYTDPIIRDLTHVCLVKVDNGSKWNGTNGFYIYTPSQLNRTQQVTFDINVLLPQPPLRQSVLQVPNFAAMFPLFNQTYQGINSSKVKFGDVVLGGPMSTVTVDSITAENLVVMSSPGEIRGSFEAEYQLMLETMSAPITANVTMRSDGDGGQQPNVRLNTGNAPINAEINLIYNPPSKKARSTSSASTSSTLSSSDSDDDDTPTWYINANTFNQAMILSINQQAPSSSPPMPVFLRATNNLGCTNITMDEYFEGMFLAQTEYATASVFDGDISSDTLANNSLSAYPTAVDKEGRTLLLDHPTDSTVAGWIGRGSKPPVSMPSASQQNPAGAPGCIEVLSVLSQVTLDLLGSSDSD